MNDVPDPNVLAPAAALLETHSGLVVAVGERVYKVKKPVDLGFLDFRSVEARIDACERELVLNRRLAPDVYLEVATLTSAHTTGGALREPVLVMRRMPDHLRLATLVAHGQDVAPHLDRLARLLSDFHDTARRGDDIAAEAGPDGLRQRWRSSLEQCRRFRGNLMDWSAFDQIAELSSQYIDGRADLLHARAARHAVDGHGDLLADDIFCLPDGPRVLDCIEFSDRLRWVDRIDDVAFLAMDLERLGHPEAADEFLDRYATHSGDRPPASLVHHYLAYRAFIRAKVSCVRVTQGATDAARDATQLMLLSTRHLRAGRVRLVVLGGAPGTGKSTLATELAPRVEGMVISTDAVRAGLSIARMARYTPQATELVYREMLRRAGHELRRGRTVIVDATWPTAALRSQARLLAESTSSTLIELECRTPVEVAVARAERRFGTGASDSEADGEVARRLASTREPWPQAHSIDTGGSVERAVRQALAQV